MDTGQFQNFTFDSLGTRWTIEIDTGQWQGDLAKLEAQILVRLSVFDANYSRFRADSLITKMSQAPGTYTLPGDAKPLLDLYRDLYATTNGLLTPLIGQTLSDAGYDADYSLKPGNMHTPPRWEEIITYQFPKLTLRQPALLDFGAIGKGYAVDIVSEMIKKAGITNFCVNGGGDIRCHSQANKPYDVALEDPTNPEQAIGIATLKNVSLCGSSGNRRAWGEFHHILSPITLKSPQHIKALWVIAETTLLADGLSTALFFATPEMLSRSYDFEYAIVGADNSLTKSNNFPAEFFS